MLQLTKQSLFPFCALSAVLCLTLSPCAEAQVAAPGTIAVKPGAAAALAPGLGPSYNNRFDLYGGLNFANGQAGQNTPVRYNMGGGELMGTYWLGGPSDGYLRRHFGLAADYRFDAGTTPVVNPDYNRVLVYQNIYSGGFEFRGPKNRYVAINLHGLAGATSGVFDNAVKNYPGGSPYSACPAQQTFTQQGNLGLYCNHTAGWGAAGGSIDFNQGPKFSVRLSPDITFEHFGTETREFFSISLGAMYRFGRKK